MTETGVMSKVLAMLLLGVGLACIVSLFGCPSFYAIPGRVKVADCSTGPAYRYGKQTLCDDFRQTTFAAFDWTTDDPFTVCEECGKRR